jgi:hypothetical protein
MPNTTNSQQSTVATSLTATEFDSAVATAMATRSVVSTAASAVAFPPLLQVQPPEAEAAAATTADSSYTPPFSDEEDFRMGSDTEGEDADEPSAPGMMELSEPCFHRSVCFFLSNFQPLGLIFHCAVPIFLSASLII